MMVHVSFRDSGVKMSTGERYNYGYSRTESMNEIEGELRWQLKEKK